MNISPVSFGKTVRVNSSIEDARRIAELANSSKPYSKEKKAQKQAKEIFNDVTAEGQAIAIELNNGKDVYVLSGDESQKAQQFYEDLVIEILSIQEPKQSRQSAFDKIMKKTQDTFNKFVDTTESVFELNVSKNKRNTQIENISKQYPGVFAVAGTKEQINQLRNIVSKSKGNGYFMEATSLYTNRKGSGLCTDAAKSGKEVAFVVTGKEATDNVSFMNYGWSSINGVSRHIDRFVELTDVKEQAKAIQEAMQQ